MAGASVAVGAGVDMAVRVSAESDKSPRDFAGGVDIGNLSDGGRHGF
jgi:hypothetical protein